ncbi:flagellar protein [Rhizobium halophilum]|uniref:flagellar protein n=1 Tax=Rhizobium halophilum TaxID=2846852 RepID=UPI001EFC9B76|nr:flagellar protein [Rhizobium halophilum]MCF6369539.1 flagellar protein [Rhizobium halophilum]
MGDRILMGAGILLAAASAFFPWYVFLNQDKFGIRTSGFEHMRDLPPRPPRNVMSVSPLAMTDRTEDEKLPPPADSLTTATVSSLGDAHANGSAFLDQSFPGKGNFRLLHVSNGRALIEDGSGMYIVRVGSILPDNSKLATIEQRDGKWVIITSSGEIYDDGAVARP